MRLENQLLGSIGKEAASLECQRSCCILWFKRPRSDGQGTTSVILSPRNSSNGKTKVMSTFNAGSIPVFRTIHDKERPCRSLGERGLNLSPSGREATDAPKAEVIDAEVKTLGRPTQDRSETSSRRATTEEMLPLSKKRSWLDTREIWWIRS
jgi:hypothetical protein